MKILIKVTHLIYIFISYKILKPSHDPKPNLDHVPNPNFAPSFKQDVDSDPDPQPNLDHNRNLDPDYKQDLVTNPEPQS